MAHSQPTITHSDRHVSFPSTHWSAVVQAGQSHSVEAAAALSELYCAYWAPLYMFVRREGHDREAAKDLTQEFFARMIERQDFSRIAREKGRFRSFLLAAMKHFLVSEWRRANSQKRGGGVGLIPLAEFDLEEHIPVPAHNGDTSEMLFDRHWAITLVNQVLMQLRREQEQAGKSAQFEVLKGLLSGESLPPYAEVAQSLGMSESAVKIAAYRLRQRFLTLLTDHIQRTVANPADVEDELRHLLSVLVHEPP